MDPKILLSKPAKYIYMGLAVLLLGTFLLRGIFVFNDAGYYMVIQNPVTGDLKWELTPGVKMRWFGKVDVYPQRQQFWFSVAKDQGTPTDDSIRIRFNDGGYANVSGSISWEMPVDIDHLNLIHSKYRSHDNVDMQLIRTVLERSVYLSGPMMSSTESYATRRNELLHVIEDQVVNGTYETETLRKKVKDPITGEEHTRDIVQIKVRDGKAVHAVDSPLKEFGIKTYNMSMNQIKYDDEVEGQIKAQQEAVAAIQISTAQAKQYEQDAITSEKQGLAKVAESKAAQEVVRTAATVEATQARDVAVLNATREKEVAATAAARDREVKLTNAKRDLEVAKLAVQTAEADRAAEILKGEGEATVRRLAIEADGALDQKLAAWVTAQKAYAAAIAKYEGNWSPGVVTGSNGAPVQNGAQALIDQLSAKAAKDLGLSLDITKAAAEKKANTTPTPVTEKKVETAPAPAPTPAK